MIRKLNNKGMTAIEILITFAIVVVIVVSMYDGIMDLKNKETVASYKLSLTTYKNLLTKGAGMYSGSFFIDLISG